MKAVFKTALVVGLCLALWPVLAVADPPAPKGTLAYSDDFSDPTKSGLEDNLRATDYSRGFHAPGVYHLITFNNNDSRWMLLPNQAYSTFSFELDVADNSDDFAGDVSGGVVVRAQDDAHLYAVLINSRKGQYAVRKLDGKDTWSDLIAWKASPLIKQQAQANHLRVDAEGDQFTLYLNGETLDSFSDGAYAKGGLGFIASNVDAVQPHLHYDNVMVYTTDAGAAQAAPAQPEPARLPNAGLPGGAASPMVVVFALALLSLGVRLRHQQHRRRV